MARFEGLEWIKVGMIRAVHLGGMRPPAHSRLVVLPVSSVHRKGMVRREPVTRSGDMIHRCRSALAEYKRAPSTQFDGFIGKG